VSKRYYSGGGGEEVKTQNKRDILTKAGSSFLLVFCTTVMDATVMCARPAVDDSINIFGAFFKQIFLPPRLPVWFDPGHNLSVLKDTPQLFFKQMFYFFSCR
jgi:hypothetical protein